LPSFSSVSNFVSGGDRAIALFDHFPFLAAFHGRAVRQKTGLDVTSSSLFLGFDFIY
jgi:hypothetical protein